jgi:hypothetical protein
MSAIGKFEVARNDTSRVTLDDVARAVGEPAGKTSDLAHDTSLAMPSLEKRNLEKRTLLEFPTRAAVPMYQDRKCRFLWVAVDIGSHALIPAARLSALRRLGAAAPMTTSTGTAVAHQG